MYLVQLDVTVEQAQLRAHEATARLAEVEFERATTPARHSGNVPQSQLDRATADLEKATAEMENVKAIIERKTIRAPFSGRVGIRQINLGQYLPKGPRSSPFSRTTRYSSTSPSPSRRSRASHPACKSLCTATSIPTKLSKAASRRSARRSTQSRARSKYKARSRTQMASCARGYSSKLRHLARDK